MDAKKIDRKVFANEIKEELKKVTWPKRAEATRLTMAVFAISLIVGIYIGIIDLGLAQVLTFFTQR